MLHQVGVGALGPVFRTYEPARDRLVAVKVFRLDITPEQAQALADELTRAAEAALFHPSIVEPIAAGVQGTVAYRAEEYVPAESLDVAMRHYAPAPPEKVLPFITQLAGAIDFARASGVGHGALHPRDIFVTPDEARVTGFGVVEALERAGLRAPVRRPYSPPERIAGEPWGTPADVFSLAAIAFEMLTGRRPSGTGNRIGDIKEESAGPHADALRHVLSRAMAEAPESRFPNALPFAAALEAAARGETGAAVATAAAAAPAKESAVPAKESAAPAKESAALAKESAAPAKESARPEKKSAAPGREIVPLPVEVEMPAREAESSPPLQSGRSRRDAAGEAAPAVDSLAVGAADLALRDADERPFVKEFEPAIVPPPRSPASVQRPAPFAHESFDRPLSVEQSGESRLLVERSRPAMLPIAIGLIIGLLLGFVGGYVVGSRGATGVMDLGTAVDSTASPEGAPEPTGESASSSAPQGSTEQIVVQEPARSPAPDVPSERPADASAANTPPASPAGRTAQAPSSRTGRLVVRSTPSRAGVTVNGEWRGRTPLTLDELAFGDYVVRVVEPGYRTGREELTLSANQSSRTLSMRLQRQPEPARPPAATAPASRPASSGSTAYFGSVYVDSRPQGATVYIGGKQYGTTPVRIPEVPIGSHVVRLELVDHRAWTTSVRVTAGEEVRATGSLEPIR